MNGYERRTQQKRAAILAAAQQLFAQRGITDVSVSEIAQLAEVSPVTVFKYFGDKMSLARETMMAYIDQSLVEYRDLMAQPIPFTEKVHQIFAQKAGSITRLGRPYLETLAWEDPLLQQMLSDLFAKITIPLYTEFIEMGKREGVIDATLPTEAVLTYLMAFLPIVAQPDLFKHSDAYLMGLVKLCFYGLIGR